MGLSAGVVWRLLKELLHALTQVAWRTAGLDFFILTHFIYISFSPFSILTWRHSAHYFCFLWSGILHLSCRKIATLIWFFDESFNSLDSLTDHYTKEVVSTFWQPFIIIIIFLSHWTTFSLYFLHTHIYIHHETGWLVILYILCDISHGFL